ncbi:MAG: 2-amino-4-hydroxy-6-hydroxymethyldihydropteridine diphosphokinase, partial [Actinomycetota bacterium]
MTETAYLGLGSNLGDRLRSLQRAVDLLGAEAGVELTRCSRVWETDPVGGPPQPDFLNVVVRAEVVVSPHDLLAACQRVEAALGRVRDVRWGPRIVDIDVL